MPRDARLYVVDALNAAKFLAKYSQDITREMLASDQVVQNVVDRQFMIIGEALFQISKSETAMIELISEHSRIIGFRHILVHCYFELNRDVVWHILEEKLPILLEELQKIVDDQELT